MRITSSVLCVLLLCLASVAVADEIRPDQQYHGPKELSIAQIGVSFTLPAGWTGALPAGESTFIAGKEGLNGYIFLVAEQSTVEKAKVEMSKTLTFAPVVMTPKGKATAKGSRVSNTFTVTGGQVPLEGTAVATIGKTGWGLMALAVAPPAELPQFQKAVDAIIASTKVVKPKAPKVAKGASGHWGKELAGKRLNKFFHGSGYSEKTQISLCPNGGFYYNLEGGGVTVNGSGALQARNGGTWSTSGDATGGALNLVYNDGRTVQYGLSMEGSKLMLDGTRWLREPINCN